MIERLRGKADSWDALEGSRPECVMASVQVTTGGLRAGHAFIGVSGAGESQLSP